MTYEILLERYIEGRISKAMLSIYVKKGVINPRGTVSGFAFK